MMRDEDHPEQEFEVEQYGNRNYPDGSQRLSNYDRIWSDYRKSPTGQRPRADLPKLNPLFRPIRPLARWLARVTGADAGLVWHNVDLLQQVDLYKQQLAATEIAAREAGAIGLAAYGQHEFLDKVKAMVGLDEAFRFSLYEQRETQNRLLTEENRRQRGQIESLQSTLDETMKLWNHHMLNCNPGKRND